MRGTVFLCFLLLFDGLSAQSLYDSNDAVVELTSEDKEVLASPDKIYVVEFYAHWCGHCIRYSPFWKHVAKTFEPWKDSIVIGAINCAVYDCSDYEIPGTPTIKVFKPFNNIPNGMEISSNKRLVFHHIYDVIRETRIAEELNPSKYPDLSLFKGKSIGEIRDNNYDKSILLFKELPELDWSELIVILFSRNSLYNFKIIHPRKKEMAKELNITSRPAAAIINWNDRRMDKVFLVDLSSYSSTYDQISAFLDKDAISNDTTSKEVILENDSLDRMDVVYEGDLEKVLKYMLTVEIPTYYLQDNSRFIALRHFFGTLLRYLPLRKEIMITILELRQWMDEQGSINDDDYRVKLSQLITKFRPFKHTPSEWKGCKGSTPYFRGYPCGLWTLFHVLTVQSSLIEKPGPMDSGVINRVSFAIIEYIKHFFSCRNCAENFLKKVDVIGYLPSTPVDTIFWMWKIHNMANVMLKGDSTEDPAHQKIIWPSSRNCPKCRNPQDGGSFLGFAEKWNELELLAYIINVYRMESIVRIPEEAVSSDDSADGLINDILSGSLTERKVVVERLQQYCSELS